MMLTVIIPAYNCANTIEKAIVSTNVFNDERITVIVVNNGSTDDTEKIVKRLCNACNRIIYSESPKGVSYARNRGIELTSTDYLTFLDADDIYISNGTENFINNLSSESDLAIYNYQVNEKLQNLYSLVFSAKKINDQISVMLDNPTKLLTVWNKVYSTHIIKENDIYFDTTLNYSEDSEFLIRYLMKISTIKFFNNVTYQYNMFSNSAVHSYNSGMVHGYLKAIDKVKRDMKDRENFSTSLNNFILMQFNLMMVHAVYADDSPHNVQIAKMKNLVSNKAIRAAIMNVKMKNIIKPRFTPIVLCKYRLYLMASIIYKIRVKQNEHLTNSTKGRVG